MFQYQGSNNKQHDNIMSSLALEYIDRTKLILRQRSVVFSKEKKEEVLECLSHFFDHLLIFLPGGIF